ncbi:MAG: hypothetical protein WAO23_06920, partial [Dethiobacteria bacterium]
VDRRQCRRPGYAIPVERQKNITEINKADRKPWRIFAGNQLKLTAAGRYGQIEKGSGGSRLAIFGFPDF